MTRILRVPHLDPTDLAFFLRSSPWCRPGGEQQLEHPDRSRLFDSSGRWTCDYDFGRGTLTLSGQTGAVWNLGSLTERWSALGRPGISDFRVEISDSDPDPSSPADWIDVRPNVRLRISLPR